MQILWKESKDQNFPGSLAVKTSLSNARGAGFIPGLGAKFPHASRPNKCKNEKNKQLNCNKVNKTILAWEMEENVNGI